jgi:hypothetical protein
MAARVVCACQPSLMLIAWTSAPDFVDSMRMSCAFLVVRDLAPPRPGCFDVDVDVVVTSIS